MDEKQEISDKFTIFTAEHLTELRRYFSANTLHLSDYTAAFAVMWQDYFKRQFAIIEDCLVFAEFFRGLLYFYYPISLSDEAAEGRALDEIENICKERHCRLHFTGVPRNKIPALIDRYGTNVTLHNPRRWRDYIYSAQDFTAFAGKKFSGQRNHINKFRKLYPGYEYTPLTSADEEEIYTFLDEFASRQLAKGTAVAKEELSGVYRIIKLIDSLGLPAGGIRIDGRLAAISVGEWCGDMLFVHIEKALTEYDGIYPAMANEFAKHAVKNGILFINREDDAGDRGLRKSKMQYNPIALGDKFNVIPHRIIEDVAKLPTITGARLTLKAITAEYADDFYRLEYDRERNRWWGYDWREHYDGEPTPEYFLNGIIEDFEKREEMPLGIFVDGRLAGEVVLHNFGYRSDCEIGVRLLKEYEGKGYAKEALTAYIDYALFKLDFVAVNAKCFKQNERSRATLLSAGMQPSGEDDAYYYFKKTAVM